MKKKEIKEKFEKLGEQIKSFENGQEDLYKTIRFILEAIRKYTDEPIFQITRSFSVLNYGMLQDHIQYYWNNKIKTIDTNKKILGAELQAYCDTHFILKSIDGFYFLVNMCEGTIADVPAQLLFSKEMKLTIEGQALKFCHTGSGVLGVRHD